MSRHPLLTPGSERAGRWVQQGTAPAAFSAFIPNPLPPDPPLRIDSALQLQLEAASLALGRLDGIGRLLPGPEALLYSYVRKEAVLSSQIEGTQSTLRDLLLHENDAAPGAPLDDVREVSSYIAALNHGLELLGTLPMSLRLIREVHRLLVTGSRGAEQAPGEFRTSQNWIGGSRPGNAAFVPPPAHEVLPALGSLEMFLHDDRFPTLLKAGLAHAQFETIHPFLDGNGRVGRMLITLVLVANGALSNAWLYMSLHFKRHRRTYYERLQRVRTHGEWEAWLSFYLDGVLTVSGQATQTISELLKLFEKDRQAVSSHRGGSIYQQAAAQSNLLVFEHLRAKMMLTIPETASACGLSKPTVARALKDLIALGIVSELTGAKRNRVFLYDRYLQILNADVDLQ